MEGNTNKEDFKLSDGSYVLSDSQAHSCHMNKNYSVFLEEQINKVAAG